MAKAQFFCEVITIYPIHIQNNWDNLAPHLASAGLVDRAAHIVTDSNVAGVYLADILGVLTPHFRAISHTILPPGEAEKNLDNTAALLAAFHHAALDRSSIIIAAGGGTISDIAGFAASIYMRGISYISLPTTLLAMADSSIGGKTGIDFRGAKNLVGSFHNPALVYMNLAALFTLDDTQYISGLAEVIKYGIILDAGLYDYISGNRVAIAARDAAALDKIIRDCCRLKSKIVAADEKEAGLRQILNYGHTFGHAIESLCGFALPHGHCVALGMVCAANFSHNAGHGGMEMFHVEHLRELLNFFGLPTVLPEGCGLYAEEIYAMMLKDKKVRGGALTLIISHKFGSVEIVKKVAREDVMRAIGSIGALRD